MSTLNPGTAVELLQCAAEIDRLATRLLTAPDASAQERRLWAALETTRQRIEEALNKLGKRVRLTP
jgi:hypothetical protein